MRIIYITITILWLLLPFQCFSQEISLNYESILREAQYRDQHPRKSLDSLLRTGVVNGENYLPYIQEQERSDSINQEIVLPIIDGILNKTIKLDEESYRICWLILQHSDSAIINKYYPFVEQLYSDNVISPFEYCAYVDRMCIYNKHYQVYGTQMYRSGGGGYVPYPVLIYDSDIFPQIDISDKIRVIYKDYKTEPQIYIHDRRDKVVIGFVYLLVNPEETTFQPIKDLTVEFANIKTTTNSYGYFNFIANESEIGNSINHVLTDLFNIPININQENADFTIVEIYLNSDYTVNTIQVK